MGAIRTGSGLLRCVWAAAGQRLPATAAFILPCIKALRVFYPFGPENLSKDEYVDFAHMMEKYLWPRLAGINRLDIYIDGYTKYLQDSGVTCLSMDTLDGTEPYEKAAETVMKQIDSGYPVPILNLNHRNKEFKDYTWHWFLLNGYEKTDNTLLVKAVTYSGFQWLDFGKLWDTGYTNKGGLVLYSIN